MELPEEISGQIVFKRAAELWLREHKRYIKPRTVRTYEEYIRALLPIFGDLRCDEIQIGHLRRYQDERGKNAGVSRINGELSTLHQVLEEAGVWKPIGKLYKPLPVSKSRSGHTITAEQEARLREVALSKPKWHLAGHCMMVMLSTTMGFGELRRMRRRDLDLEQRLVMVREGAKNDYRDRTIPLNSVALESMLWLARRWERLGGTADGQYLLPHRPRVEGGPWIFDEPMTAITTAFRQIRSAAGLPHFREYDCRVQAITKILSNPRISPQVAREIAGHISQAMQDRYSIQLIDTKRAALEALEAPPGTPELPLAARYYQKKKGNLLVFGQRVG